MQKRLISLDAEVMLFLVDFFGPGTESSKLIRVLLLFFGIWDGIAFTKEVVDNNLVIRTTQPNGVVRYSISEEGKVYLEMFKADIAKDAMSTYDKDKDKKFMTSVFKGLI